MSGHEDGRGPARGPGRDSCHLDDAAQDATAIVGPPPADLVSWASATRPARTERDRRQLDDLVARDVIRRAPVLVQRPRVREAERAAYRDGYGRGWADAVAAMRSGRLS